MYVHQRLGGTNSASAVWMKLTILPIAGFMMLQHGLPTHPMFYVLTGAAAIIWCINDLIYFEAVKNHGAALLARLSPLAVIMGFVAWFAIHPALLDKYMADMPRFLGITAALLFCAGCAMSLQRCAFSWAALKAIWFNIVGGMVGILLVKSAVDYAPADRGPFGYLGIEAAIMLAFYGVYFAWRRPDAFRDVFSIAGLRTGAVVSLFLVAANICRLYAFNYVDNPAYVTAVSMMDVVWLMIITRLTGVPDHSNKWAGLGIVAAALAIAFLKIR
jgi:hypothetical protein